MSLGRSRVLRPFRDAVGRRVHRLVDRRVREQLASVAAAEAPQVPVESPPSPRVHGPADRVRIADSALVRDALLDVEGGRIDIGAHVVFGHDVTVVTSERAAASPDPADVRVEREARVGSRAVLVGPCTIGARAEVLAGAVISGEVPPGAVVSGVAGTVVRRPTRIPAAVDVAHGTGRFYLPAPADGGAPVLHDLSAPSAEHEAALRAAPAGSTVIDVGARAGWAAFTAAVAVGPAGRVIALEPDPVRRRLLRANVVRNRLANVDVWADSGSALDDVAAGVADVSTLHVVTNGTEHLVLRAASGLLARCRPTILVRFWPDAIRAAGHAPDDVLAEYRAAGRTVLVLEAPELGDAPAGEIVARIDARPTASVTLRLAAP